MKPHLTAEIAGVSRSGYYRWIKGAAKRAEREMRDRQDFELILSAYNQHGYRKGARGIYVRMLHWQDPVVMNIKKIIRLMDNNSVCPIRKANPYRRLACNDEAM